MKLIIGIVACREVESPPARGAWIEMSMPSLTPFRAASPPARGAWIEMLDVLRRLKPLWSPPARGAWIEINRISCYIAGLSVRRPPHGGRGLKSHNSAGAVLILAVAPRTGGVD